MLYIIGLLVLGFVIWMAMTPTLGQRAAAEALKKDIEEQEKREQEANSDD